MEYGTANNGEQIVRHIGHLISLSVCFAQARAVLAFHAVVLLHFELVIPDHVLNQRNRDEGPEQYLHGRFFGWR
jgi:hypothetical protein